MMGLIDRQAAVDAVHKSIFDFFDICDDDEESPMTYKDELLLEVNKAITTQIKAIPSAQPDSKKLSSTHNALNTINRQAAYEVLTAYYHHSTETQHNALCEALSKVPSAQPERKTGRWIEENPQNSPNCRLIKCSECGDTYIVNMSIDYVDWIEGRNFCRRCGADLRGGNNGKGA